MEEFLSFNGITKLYPGVTALDDVSLSFSRGEVHALVGANGAGKSTLIKILSGAEKPNSGEIHFCGQAYGGFKPHTALEMGIGVVYQENNLVPALSVMENTFLGQWPGGRVTVNKREMRKKSINHMAQFNIDIDPDTQVADLSPAYQQIVEIVRVISRPLSVLVLDEPTAPLTVAEVNILFGIIAKLKEQGMTIIYISHRIEEIFAISDRVSVLRDGRYIGTVQTTEIDRAGLISMMVGKEVSSDCPPSHSQTGNEVVFKAENVTGNGVHNISFELKKGEILGFAGLVGCGRTELMSVLFGDAALISGRIYVQGTSRKFRTCQNAVKAGLGLIPEDRKAAGLLLENSVKVNVSLANLKKLSRFTVVKTKAEHNAVDKYATALRIKTPCYEQQVDKLSGGNQQKVVVARWLVTDSDILIFDEPTRGIDVAAKQEIYKLMRELTAEGKSILMVSSDMEELLGMSDRLVVLAEGKLAGELEHEEFDTYRILDMASGER